MQRAVTPQGHPLPPTHPRMLHWAPSNAKKSLNQIPRDREGKGALKSTDVSRENRNLCCYSISQVPEEQQSIELIIGFSQHPNTSPCAAVQIQPRASCLFENLSCKQGLVLLKKPGFIAWARCPKWP